MLGRRHWWEIFMPWLSPYSDWSVRRRGAKDGSAEPAIPAWEATEQPPFLQWLAKAGNQDLHALAKAWHNKDRRYKARWAMAEHDLEDAQRRRGDAQDKAEVALDHYESSHGHRPSMMATGWGSFRYCLLIALLCVIEFPLNAVVFRGFRESEAFTWILAFGIGSALTIDAHYLGRFLREGVNTRLRAVLSAVLVLMPFVAIAGIAYLRSAYMNHRTAASGEWSAGFLILFFVAVNMVFFAVATVASYRHHEAFANEVAKTQQVLRRTQRVADRAEQALDDAKVEREKRFQETQEHGGWIGEEVKRLASVYWTANLERRTDRAETHTTPYPRSFDPLPDVEMPGELLELTWDDARPTHRDKELRVVQGPLEEHPTKMAGTRIMGSR